MGKLIVRKGVKIGIARRVVKPSDGRPVLELLNQPLYSQKQFAAGPTTAQTVTFFKGLGNATSLQTNMTTDGMLPYPSSQDVFGIVVVPEQGAREADIVNFMNNTVFDFSISGKSRLKVPVIRIPAGCGLSGAVSTTENNTHIFQMQNGLPSPFVYFPVDIEGMSLYLPSQQDFQVTMQTFQTVAFTQALNVWAFLDGIRAQPVM